MKRRRILALSVLAFAPAAAFGAEDKKKKSGGASFLPIDAMVATTNKPGGRRGVLTVECGLDVADPTLRARADASIPRLRAAYLQTIIAYAAGLSPGSLPDADFIVRALQRQTDAVLGRPGARLLLGAILVS
jgi:hypothetical protein